MIIKDYFADGLLQIAIVLSLLRSNLDSFLDTSARPVLVRHHLSETTDGPLSGITRTDLNFHSGRFGREYPKLLDSYNDRFSAVLRDLHSLSYYRRFSGISTNVHAWLVNDGGPDAPSTSSRQDDSSDSANEINATSHDVSSPSTAAVDSSAALSEASNLMLSFEDELSKEDMELIEILYLQDVDLGIGREAFDDLCNNDAASVNATVQQKNHELKQSLVTANENGSDGYNSANTGVSSQQQEQNAVESSLSGQYVIDTETGEWVLVSPSTSAVSIAPQPSSSQTINFIRQSNYEERWEDMLSVLDLQSVLESDNSTSVSTAETDWHSQQHGAVSTLETGWDRLQHVENSDWEGHGVMPSLALVNNISMTSPRTSASSTDSIFCQQNDDLAVMQPATSYDLTSLLNNDSLPFFQSSNFTSDFDLAAQMLSNINLTTTNTALFTNTSVNMGLTNDNIDDDDYRHLVYEMSDDAVANTPATLMSSEDDFDHGSATTTLSSTLEHYSSASAALNDDHVDLTDPSLQNATLTDVCLRDLRSLPLSPTTNVTNLSDTNALFHQLLCANLQLDELNFNSNNSLVTAASSCDDNWSSGDSAVSSMHSPTLLESSGGASGFDISSEHSAAAMHSGGYSDLSSGGGKWSRMLLRDCAMRTSAHDMSSPSSSDSGGHSHRSSSTSSVDHEKNVLHNHTYPATPGQTGRRSDREDKARRESDEEQAMRCRDEKKAKEMQIPLTMEEMIDTSVEHFNELLSKYKLSDAQNQLIRDIRRRGKNKLAAQNCRKRKLEVIQTVEDELAELRRERDKLLQEKYTLDRRSTSLKQKYNSLESDLLRRLCNETGQDYDPTRYSVLQTDDGRVFIVPRADASTSSQGDDRSSRRTKRKPDKKD